MAGPKKFEPRLVPLESIWATTTSQSSLEFRLLNSSGVVDVADVAEPPRATDARRLVLLADRPRHEQGGAAVQRGVVVVVDVDADACAVGAGARELAAECTSSVRRTKVSRSEPDEVRL